MGVRGTGGGTPPYNEAYPRISALQAWKESRRGRSHVVWRNQHMRTIGTAEVSWVSPVEMMICPCIQDWEYIPSTTQDFALSVSWKGSTSDNKRPYFRCRECSREHDVVIYTDTDWWCNLCHGLRNRSECLDEVIRVSEKLFQVEREIGQGRPPGMREVAYQAKQQEWADLSAKLGRRPRRTASRDYLHLITSEWVAAGPYLDHLESRGER